LLAVAEHRHRTVSKAPAALAASRSDRSLGSKVTPDRYCSIAESRGTFAPSACASLRWRAGGASVAFLRTVEPRQWAQ
jgi:hypothetical protein